MQDLTPMFLLSLIKEIALFLNFISYLEHNQPIATVVTGLFAICAVILSQFWFDIRQRKYYQHVYELKAKEAVLKKKEKLIEVISKQIKSISHVEGMFDSWQQDFVKNYSNSSINSLLLEIDTRVNKIQLLVELYFPDFLPYIAKIHDAESFRSLCADFAMAGRFGEKEFQELDQIEMVEICNSYAVLYMQLSFLLISRKENANPIINKI
jgi:hypothetical protein